MAEIGALFSNRLTFFSIFVLNFIPPVGLLIGDSILGVLVKLIGISLFKEVGDYKFIRFFSFENNL